MSSVFLEIPSTRWVAHNEHAFAIRDSYPVTLGHTLVITRALVPTWFDATREQQLAVLDLVDQVKRELDQQYAPSGYNVGFNAGVAAGQTVHHLHVHVIPRYEHDLDDPRGGVRNVIPERGNYKRLAADWSNPPGPASAPKRRASGLSDGERGRHLGPALLPLFERADEVMIIAAFVKRTGVQDLEHTFERYLTKPRSLRIITGDYLNITQADALRTLLDLQAATTAFGEAEPPASSDDEDPQTPALVGRFELRVVKEEELRRAFHPKAYLFGWGDEPRDGVAYIGSSNLSRSALYHGVEWNLRIERRRDPATWDEVASAAEDLWRRASVIDDAWLAAYRARAREQGFSLPLGELDDEGEDEAPPTPRGAQREALDALADTRAAGHERGLVVMATGLGKTFLAAFDVEQLAATLGRSVRVLFVAHRRELLTQARRTFRRVLPDASFSWCVGGSADLSGDVVLASIQKLSRMDLSQLDPARFDYVIIDEVHHAAAPSYRRLLAQLQPRFMLGLTATPERADEGDVAGLFHDNVVFSADLGRGISSGDLVPFAYEGLRDPVDYEPIPWRSGKFDPETLATAVQTEARMDTLWEAWQRLPGTRSLVFCVSIAHARFVTAWLADKGVRVACVHSGADSFNRDEALRQLQAGELDAVTTVDLFNEGIDCKPIDRVVMLRPTASPVVFLQQLGRGLRTAEGKRQLQVLDFVGNHHSFLNRLRTLLSLTAKRPGVRDYVRAHGELEVDLPPGCSVKIVPEALDLLDKLLPKSSKNELVRVYRELRTARGQRPQAGELFRRGLNPASVRKQGLIGGWFDFVEHEGDLSDDERILLRADDRVSSWLAALERTPLTKSFKMVVLEVLLEHDTLAAGMPLDLLARRCHEHLRATPALFVDIEDVKELSNPRELLSTDRGRKAWLRYWKKNPLAAWTKASKASARPWFSLDSEHLVSHLPVPEDSSMAKTFASMTRELVDWQLAHYRRRLANQTKASQSGEISSFTMKVITNKRSPILHFGNQPLERERLPHGETDVRLRDGSVWQFRFVKIACNVARPIGASHNQLPDLLRRWFGPNAGTAGTDSRVEFRRAPEGWWAEPLDNVIVLAKRGHVTAYPSLRAAAGIVSSDAQFQGDAVEAAEVRLPLSRFGDDLFVVRATGDSMRGGKTPIHDGDWVVFEWARHKGLESVLGRIALVAIGDPGEDRQFVIKRIVRTDQGLLLRSENRAHDDLEATPETEVIARFVEVVRPGSLAPRPGTYITAESVAEAFGVSTEPTGITHRIDGHLFLMVDTPEVRIEVSDRTPGETAFVLARADDGWRYVGIGQWIESERRWRIPTISAPH